MTPHSPELVEKCRQCIEVEGMSLTAAARACKITATLVSDWCKKHGWRRVEVLRTIRVEETKIKHDPALVAAMERVAKMPKAQKEQEYDEALHTFACAVPLYLATLSPSDVITKADKIKSLVAVSREILGRSEKNQRAGPAISLNILSRAALPQAQVIEIESDRQDLLTG